ncbi:2OG-Fe(II) oxygenase family protein [Streptomyces morookaense]|uniref:2OG-Fe(II) oxygenase family protein n=1 Tax=Streptomyces morookaense TaxID=1970 RepID=UPI0033DF0C67
MTAEPHSGAPLAGGGHAGAGTPAMVLQRARTAGSALVFDKPDGLPRSLADGCFRLAVPAGFDPSPGITLCREFHRPASDGPAALRSYRGFRELEGIYFDREHFQTEHLLVDGPDRALHFPPELCAMAEQMSALTRLVLRAVLDGLGVPGALWGRVTGGAAEGRGTHWFAANHYRSEHPRLGCAPHKDTGFVTVLYIEESGLEASVDGAWVPVDPLPGHFVVNFGGAFELLTAALPQPVRALTHRVRQCVRAPGVPDRFSFAAFANPPATGDLYRIGPDGAAHAVRSSEEFLREFNAETWSDGYTDFGIAEPAASRGGAR